MKSQPKLRWRATAQIKNSKLLRNSCAGLLISLLFSAPALALNKVETIHRCLLSIYKSKRNYAGVSEQYQALISLHSQDGQLHSEYAWWLGFMKKWDEALVEARRAVELEPQNANFHMYLGIVFKQLNRHEEAMKSFERATEILEFPIRRTEPEMGITT